MEEHIMHLVCQRLHEEAWPWANETGSTDHWGPNDEHAQEQQDIRLALDKNSCWCTELTSSVITFGVSC